MKSIVTTILFFVWTTSQLFAQQGHAIRVKIKGIIPQKTCFLGHYNGFGSITDIEQSLPDQNGYMIFTNQKALPEGLYRISITPTKSLEIIISDQQNFSLSTDTSNFLAHTKFIGSVENQLFYDYQSKMAKMIAERRAIGNNENRQDSLQTEVLKYRESYLRKNEGMFSAKIIKVGVIPEPKIKLSSDEMYQFFQKHFWDNIDLTDERMLRTPFLAQKIDEYIDKLTNPNVDSLTNSAVSLIEKTKTNKDIFRYFLSTIVRKFESPKINGTEGVYVNLVEKYYLTKQATWIDDYTLGSIKQKAETMKPLLLGKVFPDMELKNPEGKVFNINSLDAKYTVILFYSPTCTHCIETMPKIKKFYEEYQKSGVEILAISVREGGKIWTDFIEKQGIVTTINHGWEVKDEGYYYYKYDVVTYPTIYVLNEKKQIIGRKLTGDELGNFIDFTEGK